MLGIDDLAEGILAGTPLGTGLMVATAVMIVGRRAARPAAKQALKGYFAASTGVHRLKQSPSEQLEDLYARAPSAGDVWDVPEATLSTAPRRQTRRRAADDAIETLHAETVSTAARRPRRRTRTDASSGADAGPAAPGEASA